MKAITKQDIDLIKKVATATAECVRLNPSAPHTAILNDVSLRLGFRNFRALSASAGSANEDDFSGFNVSLCIPTYDENYPLCTIELNSALASQIANLIETSSSEVRIPIDQMDQWDKETFTPWLTVYPDGEVLFGGEAASKHMAISIHGAFFSFREIVASVKAGQKHSGQGIYLESEETFYVTPEGYEFVFEDISEELDAALEERLG